jgi:hypothetical protein
MAELFFHRYLTHHFSPLKILPMSLLDTVANYLKGNKEKMEAPESVCPNC